MMENNGKSSLRSWLSLLVLFPLLSALVSCGRSPAFQSVSTSDTESAAGSAPIHLSGYIEGSESKLGVLVPGKVSSVLVREGQPVKKNQVLLRLDDEDVLNGLKSINELLHGLEKSSANMESVLGQLQKKEKSLERGWSNTKSHPASEAAPQISSTPAQESEQEQESQPGKESQPDPGAEKIRQLNQQQLLLEKSQLDEALAQQRKLLQENESAAQSMHDEAYQSQLNAIAEIEKVEAPGKQFSIWPLGKIKSIKQAALSEVLKTKQAAAAEVYKSKKEAMQKLFAAQKACLEESFKVKRTALEQAGQLRQSMSAETSSGINKSIDGLVFKLNAKLKTVSNNMNRLEAVLRKQKAEIGKSTEIGIIDLQKNEAELKLAALQSELVKARAKKSELLSTRRLFEIKSPIDGICSACNVQVGDTAAPGQILIRVSNPETLSLRAFAAEGDLGRIKIGQEASVKVDSGPGRGIKAKVQSIAQEASFTPENTYFKDERIRQSFAVILALENNDGSAKAGMPAEAEIATKDSAGAN